jgi:hypothetical protein
LALPPISGRVPSQPASPQPAADPRIVAQRAFFQAALAKAGAPDTVTKAPVIATPVRTESRAVQPAATPLQDERVVPPHPGRILRPGSLIDIKV